MHFPMRYTTLAALAATGSCLPAESNGPPTPSQNFGLHAITQDNQDVGTLGTTLIGKYENERNPYTIHLYDSSDPDNARKYKSFSLTDLYSPEDSAVKVHCAYKHPSVGCSGFPLLDIGNGEWKDGHHEVTGLEITNGAEREEAARGFKLANYDEDALKADFVYIGTDAQTYEFYACPSDEDESTELFVKYSDKETPKGCTDIRLEAQFSFAGLEVPPICGITRCY